MVADDLEFDKLRGLGDVIQFRTICQEAIEEMLVKEGTAFLANQFYERTSAEMKSKRRFD
jgi:hypothetical protein